MIDTMRGTLAVLAAQYGVQQADMARFRAEMAEGLPAPEPEEPRAFQDPPSEE